MGVILGVDLNYRLKIQNKAILRIEILYLFSTSRAKYSLKCWLPWQQGKVLLQHYVSNWRPTYEYDRSQNFRKIIFFLFKVILGQLFESRNKLKVIRANTSRFDHYFTSACLFYDYIKNPVNTTKVQDQHGIKHFCRIRDCV